MDEEILPGTIFANRIELANSRLHRQRQAGIAWTTLEGAYSIVLSGGYEDDEDYGSVIIYTGEGGRDSNTGLQIADQELIKGNLALAKSKHAGKLVNVIRGYQHKSKYSPKAGYAYAGKYIITDYSSKIGKSGYIIYTFRLVSAEPDSTASLVAELPAAERRPYLTQRIIRDTKQSQAVKELYDYTCQVCGLQINLPLGSKYAEGAHIRPLGEPHNGPDDKSNLLCLCPNHHVMFDNYTFSINPTDYTLIGDMHGNLLLRDGHDINTDHFKYHNNHYNIKNS